MIAVDRDVEYECAGVCITPATTRCDFFGWVGDGGASLIKSPSFWHATAGVSAYPELPTIERSTITIREIEALNILQATEGIELPSAHPASFSPRISSIESFEFEISRYALDTVSNQLLEVDPERDWLDHFNEYGFAILKLARECGVEMVYVPRVCVEPLETRGLPVICRSRIYESEWKAVVQPLNN